MCIKKTNWFIDKSISRYITKTHIDIKSKDVWLTYSFIKLKTTIKKLLKPTLFKLEDCENAFPQTLQTCGRWFSCTCRMWIRRRSRFSNDLQTFGFWDIGCLVSKESSEWNLNIKKLLDFVRNPFISSSWKF